MPLPLASRSSSAATTHTLETRARILLLASIAVTVALYVLPYGALVGYPLVLLSTVVHEMGHGVAGVLVGGRWDSFEMYSDGSGVAHISGYDGRFSSAFVAAGGLCGPAVVAAIALMVASRPRIARVGLGGLGLFLAIVDVWLVRSWFGISFVFALSLVAIAVAWKARAEASQMVLLLVGVQLALSVFSRGDYLFTAVARTASGTMPSDVANMSRALFLPYWVWGAICGTFSIAMLALGAWFFFRVTRGRDHDASHAKW